MNRIQNIFEYLKEELKFSATNPLSFEEKWSVQTTRLRMLSLILLVLLVFGILFTYFVLKGPFSFYFTKNDTPIERQQLENQKMEIQKLEEKIAQQEKFVANLQAVILGKVVPEASEKKENTNPIDYKSLNSKSSTNEQELAQKVKNQMRTKETKSELSGATIAFGSPLEGTISQVYNRRTHPAIDIVAKKGSFVKSTASGMVVYAGYSQKDGHFIIIDHGNETLSIYKHNKVNLKEQGQRVQMGDPIAIVGNTGENSSGPHLHFEIWIQQKSVDPRSIIGL